jgi:hypothetical protein
MALRGVRVGGLNKRAGMLNEGEWSEGEVVGGRRVVDEPRVGRGLEVGRSCGVCGIKYVVWVVLRVD